MLKSEVIDMNKAIKKAANRIQDMLTTSRAEESGMKLEVNEKIVPSSTILNRVILIKTKKTSVYF